MSILSVWISEKPRFYKLIYQRSKHSNIDSPIQSNEALESNYIDCEFNVSEKKSLETDYRCQYSQCNF
ncbi:unnamed protein product [Arctia plantaginis]|uniref:Uncharacterized protein n=1 Tax=Arctia plantaginis TaxID=874455 RepID=A0A8S1AZ77_ARCPL|nr:unnamed protein product [Arctia plantaginis]CAB3259891.1 unnamed protein product [Arctia plantaginis]